MDDAKPGSLATVAGAGRLADLLGGAREGAANVGDHDLPGPHVAPGHICARPFDEDAAVVEHTCARRREGRETLAAST